MNKMQLAVCEKGCRAAGRTIRVEEGMGTITVWPQYQDQTPDGGPITFSELPTLSRWLKEHPFMKAGFNG